MVPKKITNYRKKAFKFLPPYCDNCSSAKDLQIHHRDGNRSNNVVKNLQILCKKCHLEEHGRRITPKYNTKFQKNTPRWKKK